MAPDHFGRCSCYKGETTFTPTGPGSPASVPALTRKSNTAELMDDMAVITKRIESLLRRINEQLEPVMEVFEENKSEGERPFPARPPLFHSAKMHCTEMNDLLDRVDEALSRVRL